MADQSLIDRAVSPPQAPSVIDSALSPAQPASKIDDAIGTSQPTQAFQSDDAQAAAAQATSIGPQPVDVLDKALTKKLRDACASATNQIAAASNLCREIQLHPREPSHPARLDDTCYRKAATSQRASFCDSPSITARTVSHLQFTN